MIAVKGQPDAVRADVGDGFHLYEGGIDRAEEHAALVACADDAHADGAPSDFS